MSLLLAGFYGAQRRWYQKAWSGERFGAADVRRATLGYIGRFFVLGFTFSVLIGLPLGLLEALLKSWYPAVIPVIVAVAVIGIDFLLTFMTPALALTTRSTNRAISIGWSLLRHHWPSCAAYVVIPPMALQAVWFFVPSFGRVIDLTMLAGLALIALAFKGATAAYYLRTVSVEAEPGYLPGQGLAAARAALQTFEPTPGAIFSDDRFFWWHEPTQQWKRSPISADGCYYKDSSGWQMLPAAPNRPPAGAQFSEDRYFWWDASAAEWKRSPLSQEGHYFFDGAAWQPLPNSPRNPVAPAQFSDDRYFWWDDAAGEWRRTPLSDDGRWYFDGSDWQAMPAQGSEG